MARKNEPVDFKALPENIHEFPLKSPKAEQEIMIRFSDLIILVEEKKIEEFVDYHSNLIPHQISGKELKE